MKINILGASGSGTTTLGLHLGQKLGWVHLDADDYYWVRTNPPFQKKIPREKRNKLITKDFEANKSVIISGSMVSWGESWQTAFDLVVFLYLPPELRIKRLQSRESVRYGTLLQTDPLYVQQSREFIEWAKKYDDINFKGRSITVHNNWLRQLSCPVLRIEGDTTIENRIQQIVKEINRLSS